MERKEIMAFKLEPNMVELIKKYAEINNTTYTKIVEYALTEYFLKRKENILL